MALPKSKISQGWGTPLDIKQFQQAYGIKPTGTAGPITRSKMADVFSQPWNTGVQDAQAASTSAVAGVVEPMSMDNLVSNYSPTQLGGMDFNKLGYTDGSLGTNPTEESEAMKIAKMGQKSDMEKYASVASGVAPVIGGLASLYSTIANAKYMKDQAKMQKNMIRGDEANKSAFAKAAGGTYQRSGV